jgi:tyrosine-protein phosphatase YwqE
MIVISELLDMFVRDPQIETNEATYLINEIVSSITKSKALEDVLVIASLPFCNVSSNHKGKPSISSYNRVVHTRFDKSMEIIDKENNMIDIKIRNNIKKTKNITNDCHDRKLLSINKRDLLIVSAPTK